MSDEQKTQVIPIISDLENVDLKQMHANTIILVTGDDGDREIWRKTTENRWCECHAHCTDCENWFIEGEVEDKEQRIHDPNKFFTDFRIVALPIETVLELLT